MRLAPALRSALPDPERSLAPTEDGLDPADNGVGQRVDASSTHRSNFSIGIVIAMATLCAIVMIDEVQS